MGLGIQGDCPAPNVGSECAPFCPSSSLTVPSPVACTASITVTSSSPAASTAAASPSELPLCQVQPSPSEAQVSTILSPISPTMLPSQPARVKSQKCPLWSVAVAATAAMKEPSLVAQSSTKWAWLPDIVEVCDMCSQKKVKCKQEPGQLASTPCVWCKTCGVTCVQSKKVGCCKCAPWTPTASTVATSIAAKSSHNAGHFDLAWDMDGPVLNLITGGMVTATKAESSAVRFWHYKAEKSCRLWVMVTTRDNWIQDIYLKSLKHAVYNAAAELLAKHACTATLDSTSKGKGRVSANPMGEDEVVELASDGSKDEEGDDKE
ncbi:hypothetical protein EI94DRAFT_1820850 [Lactarius quietus]|nr:hypothetical protein EI94DRAFT_1820850 [Lactarius quietus]